MKKFIIYIITILFAYLLLLECITRGFSLSGQTLPEINLNNNRLLQPDAEGYWVAGGMREIKNHYKINQQGFNSIKNYTNLSEDKINIAIIGDSYIQGCHVDVEKSIGRILEHETKNIMEVHEYGKAGGNIVDFSLMFDQWIKNKYDYTFMLITNKDIVANKASFMGKGNKVPKKSLIREIYNRCYFIRYLNINHKLNHKLKKTFSFSMKSKDKNDSTINDVNTKAFKPFDSTTIILYEKERLDTALISNFGLTFLEVVHQYTPIDYGFDSHWNFNGRKNCAITIKNYLEERN